MPEQQLVREKQYFFMIPLRIEFTFSNLNSSQVVAKLAQGRDVHCNNTGIAYFYCDFTRSELQCAKNTIGSLVAQLCSQFSYPDSLLRAYQAALVPGKGHLPTWDVLQDALAWFSSIQKIFILVDALDECEDRQAMLEFLSKLQG